MQFKGMIDGLKDVLANHPLIVSMISVIMNWITSFQEPIVWLLTVAIMVLTALVKYEEWIAKRKARKNKNNES